LIVVKYLLVIAAILLIATSAKSHHSDAGIDMESVIAFDGIISEFSWRNPHVYFLAQVEAENGEVVEWAVQLGPTNVLSRRGWSRDTLEVGDSVTVRAHPSVSGRPYAIMESVDKAGGLNLVSASGQPAEPASTSTIAGKWIADRMATFAYPGGFDGFFSAQLELTEAGIEAQARFDPLSAENPESTCIGRPTPASLVSSSLYLIEIEVNEASNTIVFRSEYFDEERTVYMDGRAHPPNDERFSTGHSIGRWEGDQLVVDTTNFSDHRSPYQIGVPSGAEKHVVETYELNDAGTRIALTFMLEDSEYLTAPMTHSRDLMYSPHLDMFVSGCDPEATSRFVEQ
jgi:hypothetical protein